MPIIRALLVLLGILAILVSIGALVAEVLAFVDDGRVAAKPLGAVWAKHHLLSLQLFQVGIERRLGLPSVWQGGIQPLLAMAPIAVAGIFALAGIVLIWLGRLGTRRRVA